MMKIRLQAALLLVASAFVAASAYAYVPVVIAPDAPSAVSLAAEDLSRCLKQIYPQETLVLTHALPKTGMAILMGTLADQQVRTRAGKAPPTVPES